VNRSFPCPPVLRNGQRGFTLIELIVVMILVGILGVAVLPRFAEKSVFEARGFKDETLALLQYAQKAAIAQRRYVCVTFTGTTSASLSVGATTACGTPLAGPTGVAPFSVTARSGGYAATPTNFYFDAVGRPSVGQTISISGSSSLTVETETGYVR
jgi:MSHA pilin protein MshC